MRRYFPSIKHYSWIILVCTIVTALAGAVVAKSQPTAYLANASLLIDAGAPGTTFPGTTSGSTDSISQAADDAAEIPTRSVMNFVFQFDPHIHARHYTADDLVIDTSVTAPSTTTSNIVVTVTALKPPDAVMLVNDVAQGYQAYKQKILQDQLDANRKTLQDQITAATQQKTYWEGKIHSLASTTLPDYTIYNNNLTDATRTLDALQTQLQNLPPTVNSDVFITSLAKLSDVTSTSKSTLVIAATTGIGLVLGILLMLLMVSLDNRLRGDDLVKEKLGFAYLGGLSTGDNIVKALQSGTGNVTHEFADICANLRLTRILPGQWQAPKGAVLLVTSSQVAEGKSTVAAALASTVARGGGTAVVVEGNLRKPSTHLTFGVSPAGIGLSGLLKSGNAESIDAAVQRSNIPGVWILPGGPAMDDPTFMLGQRFPSMLAQLRKKTDLVIVDGPALLSGADAALLATMVDGVAVVLDSRHDRLPLLLRAKEVLISTTATPVGIILNRLPRRKSNHYYASATPVAPVVEPQVTVSTHNGNGAGNGQSLEQMGAPFIAIPPSPSAPTRNKDTMPPLPGVPNSPAAPGSVARVMPSEPPTVMDSMRTVPNPKTPSSLQRRVDMSPLPPLRSGKDG